MDWRLENFWILLAGMIILVSGTLALVMYCICKRLLRQGKNWEISTSSKYNQKDDQTYENVIDETSMSLPPLPPRNVPVSANTFNYALQENESQQPYSTVMKKRVSVPDHIEPISDYDDVDISIYRN